MHYLDMKIQVHFRDLSSSFHLTDVAVANLRKQGYTTPEVFGVQVVESPRGEMAEPEIIPYTLQRKVVLESLLKKLEKERKTMSLDEVAALGKALADILFYGTVRDMLVRCLDYAEDRGQGLRLRLVLKDPEAARIPWEYVYFQRVTGEQATWSGFLGLIPHVSIVRHEPMQITSRPATTPQRPLKIYVGFAEPGGIGEDLDEESIKVNIEEALREEIEAGRIVLTMNDQIQVTHLDEVAGYGIFNFSGHGAYMTEEDLAYYRNKYRIPDEEETETEETAETEDAAGRKADRTILKTGFARRRQKQTTAEKAETTEETTPAQETTEEPAETEDTAGRKADRTILKTGFARRRQKQTTQEESEASQGILIFEKEGRYPHFYPAVNLAQRLTRAGVSVVVMDSCYSAKTDSASKWTGLAAAMVRVGIPAVVGMQFAFSDPAAREFWTGFYGAIAAGLSLDEAVSCGRQGIIDLEPEPSPDDPEVMLTGQNDFGFPTLYMRSQTSYFFPELTNDPALGSDWAQTSQEAPHELALLKDLASRSPGGDFVFLYYTKKKPGSS